MINNKFELFFFAVQLVSYFVVSQNFYHNLVNKILVDLNIFKHITKKVILILEIKVDFPKKKVYIISFVIFVNLFIFKIVYIPLKNILRYISDINGILEGNNLRYITLEDVLYGKKNNCGVWLVISL